MDPLTLTFYALAGLVALCSTGVVLSRNPVTSAMFLVADLFALAGIYASLDAHFAAAIQILVYAGAIVVLFMFVIMLLNLAPDAQERMTPPPTEIFMLILTLAGFGIVGGALMLGDQPVPVGDRTVEAVAAAGGNTYAVGMTLFTKYLWPFELASVLILMAIVAAVVIAKKDRTLQTHGSRGTAGKGRVTHGAG